MDDLGFAQLSALMLAKKLGAAAKLPEEACRLELDQTARELRNTLITLGLRKRKSGAHRMKAALDAMNPSAANTPPAGKPGKRK